MHVYSTLVHAWNDDFLKVCVSCNSLIFARIILINCYACLCVFYSGLVAFSLMGILVILASWVFWSFCEQG